MNVYKIPESLYPEYHGCGYAVAAVFETQVKKIVYLRDVFEEHDYDEDLEGPTNPEDLTPWLTHPAIEPTLRELNALGNVVFGMLSCYELVEL